MKRSSRAGKDGVDDVNAALNKVQTALRADPSLAERIRKL